ncbi:NUDIX domain-containing protein [Candidatus Saccharibacteria bacterium]|nr:NUDIX domain-containing protein [Candidatus Saccharibacteria bacterium]
MGIVEMSKEARQTVYVFDGVVFDKTGRILIDQRENDELEAVNDQWEVPGGKLEFGETPEEGIKREIYEETGYFVNVKRVIPYTDVGVLRYPDKIQYTVVMYYLCELDESMLHFEAEDHKIGRYKWIQPSELDEYDFMFGNRKAIEKAIALRVGKLEDSESGYWEV